MLVATHDGPFHADDVTAFALIRTFVDADAAVVRTRDADVIARADAAIDVGGSWSPEGLRFDHHQVSYSGDRSSAGMVLDWLEASGRVEPSLAERLRRAAVDYLDAVDTGRRAPDPAVPCLPRLVEALNFRAEDAEGRARAFVEAALWVEAFLRGLVSEHRAVAQATAIVVAAMEAAVAQGSTVVELPAYVPWKPIYFAHGGETHPTAFVLHPDRVVVGTAPADGADATWRVVAIPPKLGDFGQKTPLPEAWAGLTDDALAAVTGVPGSVFCHKNRFIAVFQTRAAAEDALRRHGLWSRTAG